jgi:acyl-CoA reductase-like NAD-dependent aldehyde dehydrogenase
MTHNAATEHDLPPETTLEQLNVVLTTAHHAFDTTRQASPAERQNWLEAIAQALESRADELVRIAEEESHLPEGRLRGELTRTVFQLRLLGHETLRGEPLDVTIDHADPNWGMGPRPDIRRVNEPLGVVGVFGASNFPFAFSVIGGDSASALSAGCPVVHKAHDAHPRLARKTADIVVTALHNAGAPDGAFSLATGFHTGQALVSHPLIKAVAFTGSTAGGQALAARIAARDDPIPFFGEMSSTNPVFVTRHAWQRRREDILHGFIASVAQGNGQFCTKPGFLIIPAGTDLRLHADALLEGVAITDMLTPTIREAFLSSYADLQATSGVTTITDNDAGGGITLLATNAATVIHDPSILGQEMFGPASVIIEYDDDDELLEIAAVLEGQLTVAVQAENDDDIDGLLNILAGSAGRVLWNQWPTGVSVTYAQQHGGPYPATSAPATTSVGTAATTRFLRPVAYQGFPQDRLPASLRDDNPWQVRRRIDGTWEQ